MDVYHQVKHRSQAPTLARKFDISHGFSVVQKGRADRRTYDHVITNIYARNIELTFRDNLL